jgi:Uma2 family endonuclease
MYTYADALVICGEPQFAGDQKDIILNPLLIVEVLSPSTESYDRGTKFALYRTIRTFREYLVVHQDQRWVEHHSKQDDGGWLLHEYTEGAITIPSLQIEISLQDLYSVAVGLE